LNVPAEQGVQVAAEAAEYWPAAHAVNVAEPRGQK
jgi:hypothetical protein